MSNFSVSRRQLLAGASATAAAGAFGITSQAVAKAPLLNAPAPAFYRFKLGTIEATVVSDGPLAIGEPKNTFRGPTPDELNKMMSDQFLPTNNVVLDQNALVINTGDKLAVFETGMSSVKRNDAMGRLVANLKASGIDPNDVDAVIPTHAHIDHIGGIMAADGSRNFPNAQIYISQADLEFWTDDKRLGTPAEGSALAARGRADGGGAGARCGSRLARPVGRDEVVGAGGKRGGSRPGTHGPRSERSGDPDGDVRCVLRPFAGAGEPDEAGHRDRVRPGERGGRGGRAEAPSGGPR